ncbi:MAG: hypothetical protein IKB33_08020 [Spirochaetaceae bacterium]|nr:hypothetical protein [Spirochaetaceae bacterium]
MKKFALLGIILSILFIVSSCTKKTKEVVPETIWSGTTDIQGIPLSSTLTIFSDDSFTLDTTVTFFGVGMDFNKVGLGTVQENASAEGEITFVLEELASDIVPLLESVGAAAIPLPLTITATIKDETLTLPDVGLGQEISLRRQSVEE